MSSQDSRSPAIETMLAAEDRSGKIMRRLLRDVAENRPLGETTTLADPAVVEEIRDHSGTESED